MYVTSVADDKPGHTTALLSAVSIPLESNEGKGTGEVKHCVCGVSTFTPVRSSTRHTNCTGTAS